ncbi:MAG: MurT ligase domain-containing protein [Oscillospiraceae bacterium]|jgi:UDP-N-acetylmuramyl tripeptide synthase|nr:MurT ligase domain-containing protein [Oscillospiraceae bacterium]
MRLFIALFAAKFTRLALRLCGRNASYLPGAVALKICPDFLRRAARPPEVVAVTGTNGKTTVSNLLRDALSALGKNVLSNRLGSNVAAGIAASLAQGATLGNKARHDVAVFEVDERYSPKILPSVEPKLVIVTNLFRDSVMRNAHPEFIISFLTRAIPDSAKLLLNADDPISNALRPDLPRAYFGIRRMESDVTECVNLINDCRVCPKCGAELLYEYRRYHHIGKCRCPECDYASPEYDYAGEDVDFARMTVTVRDSGGEGAFKLPSDSVFNVYNVVTVVAALRELGFGFGEIARAMDAVKIIESRYNERSENGTRVIMQMSKDRNALAGSRALDYVSSRSGAKEIVLMMNNYTDAKKWSENISWMYDCDFEFLNSPDITRIVTAGPRARDYYLRLLIAGIAEDKLRCVDDEADTPSALDLPDGGDVYILYGTDGITHAYAMQRRVLDEKARRRQLTMNN